MQLPVRGFAVGRMMLGILYALAAYAVVILAALLVGRSGIDRNLEGVAMVLVAGGGAALLGLTLAGAIALFRGRGDTGTGLLIGVAIGLLTAAVGLFPRLF
jgi:hypothetical protein